MKEIFARIAKRFRFSSLRVRLQVLVWVAIIPMALLVVSENMLDRSRKEAEIREQVAGLVNLAEDSLDRHVNNARSLLLAASYSDVVQKGDPASLSAFLRNMHEHYPEYVNFGAVDLHGNVFASAIQMKTPVNASDVFYFQQTLKSRAFTVGEYQIGRITGLEVIIFGQPVFDGAGKIKFVLFASMDIKWLNRLWENIQLLPDSTFTVTDNSGNILFRYPLVNTWVGKNMAHIPIVRIMLAEAKGMTEANGLDNEKQIYAFTATGTSGSNIHMAVGVSQKTALMPINRMLAISLLALALVAALGLLLARFYSNRFIMRPIKALREGADRFASGDYTSRINLSDGENELITLAKVFDNMAETIEKKSAAQQETEEKLHAYLDNISDVIWLIDANLNMVYVSPSVTRMLGVSSEELIGHPSALIIHPDDLNIVMGAQRYVLEHPGEPHTVQYRVRRKDGCWIHVESTGINMLNNPLINGVLVTMRDVTERKKSEELIKNILESVDEGFIIIDPEYRIISANRAYCEQMKAPDCDIIGRYCYEVSHHRDKPCFMGDEECAPWHTFKTGVPHMTIHTHYDKDNNPVYVETKSYPMKDSSGKSYAVIETLNNITEKRRLEDQLRHAQKMEAIGTLAGGIAHDFNNILSAIIGYGGLMQMQMKPDDPQLSQLKEILAAGDRAAQLTRGLLTFCRKQVMEIKTVNLNAIIEGFKKMLTRIIGEDIELNVKLSEKDLTAKADIVQVEQVMMNLAANARDAMPQGGMLTIESRSIKIGWEFIKAHGYGEPGKYALITVSDTGIGMDEKTRERMFEPFYTTKEMGRGTGLGLAIVYGIVTQHDGYIRCYSEPGKGTTFRIYIPLAKAAADKLEKEEAVMPVGGTETILIAEDDATVRGLIKLILEGFGYTVMEAVDGKDAVNKFKDNKDKIHLLLFDLIMPGKNGKDAYEEIEVMRHDIRVIFVSGYARDIIQRFGIEEGIEFISKPVLPNELLRKVREELDK